MPNTTKITELLALTALPAPDDLLIVHDTDAGIDKSLRVDNLLEEGGIVKVTEVDQSLTTGVANIITVPEFDFAMIYPISYAGTPFTAEDVGPAYDWYYDTRGVPLPYVNGNSHDLGKISGGARILWVNFGASATSMDFRVAATSNTVLRIITFKG